MSMQKNDILYDSDLIERDLVESLKDKISLIIITAICFLAVIILIYYITKLLYIFTLERELIILLMLRIFASSLALFFFTMSTIVGTIIIFKNNTIKITNTKLIFKTPFNKIPFMKKNQKISYENIWKFFSNENNQFPYTFIVLKDKKVIGISKSDIPSFESFLEILKMKIKIHSIDRWNYVKVKEYINKYYKD